MGVDFQYKSRHPNPRYRCWINKNRTLLVYGRRERERGEGGWGLVIESNSRARTMPVGGATRRRRKDTGMPTTFPPSTTSIRPTSSR